VKNRPGKAPGFFLYGGRLICRIVKIGLVIFRGDAKRGGAEGYTVDLAAKLAQRGHQVDLIASRFGDGIAGVQAVPIAVGAPTRAGRYLAFLDGLDAHLAAARYDIVHAMLPVRSCDIYHPHAGMAAAGIQTHLARRTLPGRAAAQLANRLNRKRHAYAKTERDLLERPNRPIVLCLSDYVKGSILKHYPHIGEDLVKLFNAVDLQRFDPTRLDGTREAVRRRWGIGPEGVVALMIAQHFDRKGLPQVIDAAAQVEPHITVVVVGKDDPAANAERARRLGIGQRIIFAGTTDSPAEFYSAADFFVLPTRHDSCSLVVLEALAMGLPTISTVFNGACEIMTPGRHGFVLENPGDVAALAAAMRRMLDPSARAAMRQACLELRGELSFDAHVERLEQIYADRIGERI
jgi:UDP-glucose:(heptosyl)LPS alpha-1,3-glucosyltransferase